MTPRGCNDNARMKLLSRRRRFLQTRGFISRESGPAALRKAEPPLPYRARRVLRTFSDRRERNPYAASLNGHICLCKGSSNRIIPGIPLFTRKTVHLCSRACHLISKIVVASGKLSRACHDAEMRQREEDPARAGIRPEADRINIINVVHPTSEFVSSFVSN